MLGLVLARAQEGRAKEARAVAEQMKKRFPQSPYTQRAQQALDR
jgi:TolA-binding protein